MSRHLPLISRANPRSLWPSSPRPRPPTAGADGGSRGISGSFLSCDGRAMLGVGPAGRSDRAVRAVWSIQEPGHYVLRGGARTIGHVVEAPDGSFLSFDEAAAPIARHDTLWSAQARLQPPGPSARIRSIVARRGRCIAAVALSLAFSTTTVAAMLCDGERTRRRTRSRWEYTHCLREVLVLISPGVKPAGRTRCGIYYPTMSGDLRDSPAALSQRLAAILIPELYASDPVPILRKLRAAAGSQTETLARVCGQIAGFSANQHTRVMCSAIITEIQGADTWVEQSRRLRERTSEA